MSTEEILQRLRARQGEIARDYRARVVGIYGSYARGEQQDRSDLDMLVAFDRGATYLTLFALEDFLQELLQCKVDICTTNGLRKEIAPSVERDLVAL